MSGESPPSIPGRFTGLNNNSKKYSNTPKSPLLGTNTAGGNRNSQARARLLSGKISAPRPINLPSLRREHAVGTDVPIASSPSSAPNHGWGASSSPFTSPKQSEIEQVVASDNEDQPSEINNESQKSSPPTTLNEEASPPPVRAWAAVQHTVKPPSNDFPTAAEAIAGKSNGKDKELDEDEKDYLKFIMSDPNHKSWDEMVAEDFEDDFTETIGFSELSEPTENNETVSPSERFTEDYDRSYPPQLKQTRDNDSYKSFRNNTNNRNDDNYRYNNYDSNNNNSGRRYSSSEGGGNNERRHSNDRWNSANNRRDSVDQKNTSTGGGTAWQRRPSYDRKVPYQPTLLQRNRRMSEQSARSDHSREDHSSTSDHHQQQHQNALQIITEPDTTPSEGNPAEITAVQREVMMTAAERAKKRRDEEEAEFEAARERARQKAARLALLSEPKEEEKKVEPQEVPVEILKNTDNNNRKNTDKEIKPDSPTLLVQPQQQNDEKMAVSSPTVVDVSKPWNLVAAKKNQGPSAATPTTPAAVAKPSTTEEEEKPKLSESNTTNTSSKASTALAEDDQSWEKHVSDIRKSNPDPKTSAKRVTANDWLQYADRLQERSNSKNINVKHDNKHDKKHDEKSNEQIEVIDFQKNQGWGDIPSNITHGRGRRNEGWTIGDEENQSKSHGRGRGRKISNSSHTASSSSSTQRRKMSDTADTWRQHPVKEPVVLEILKHSPPPSVPEKVEEPECPKQKCASKISDLLHDSPSPIFPLSIGRLVGKKPHNISFMVDTEESDEEITMTASLERTNTNQETDEQIESKQQQQHEEEGYTTPSDSAESSSSSPAVGYNQKMEGSELKRMTGNANFPVLIYQFPTSPGHDASSPPAIHGYVTRPDGSQQRPMGVYLSPPPQYVSGNQYMVPYPQAGTGNVQPLYFPTVSWQQQQQRYNVARHSSYNNSRSYNRSNNRHDDDYKYSTNNNSDNHRGSYRKRGQYQRGRGHSSYFKRNTEFDHSSTPTTTVQDP